MHGRHAAGAHSRLGDDDVTWSQEAVQPRVEAGRRDEVARVAGNHWRDRGGDGRCGELGRCLRQPAQHVGHAERAECGIADFHVVGPDGHHASRVNRVHVEHRVDV